MLKTKSILAPKEELDGIRISIMSRHTLEDGITSHPNISLDSYERWLPNLGPPLKLIGDYYKRNLPWKEFEKRYLNHLQQTEIQLEVKNLARISLELEVTLLCIEDKPEHCHRRLLAEECKKYQPDLILEIK